MRQPRPPRRTSAALAALRGRDFRFLFLSTIATGYGQWAQMIGLNWLVFVLSDHSATELAIVNAIAGFTRLLIGPFVGVALDRWNRRTLVIGTTWVSALQALVIGVLVIAGFIDLWHTYLIAAIEAVINTANQNARQAFAYDITDEETLANAVALSSIAQNIARITGPPLTGAIIGIWGTAAPFVFMGVVMVIGTALTLPIGKQTRQAARVAGHPLRSLWDGLVYVSHDRALLGLIAMISIASLLIYPYLSLLPVFAEEVLDAGAGGYGTLAAAAGVGSVAGLVALALAGNVRHKGLVLQFGLLIYVLFLIAFSQSRNLWLSAALLALGGVTHSMALAMSQTLAQLLPRNDMRGRVTGVVQTSFGLMPLGALPMGFAVSRWGAAPAVGAFFVAATVLFVVMLGTWKSLRTV